MRTHELRFFRKLSHGIHRAQKSRWHRHCHGRSQSRGPVNVRALPWPQPIPGHLYAYRVSAGTEAALQAGTNFVLKEPLQSAAVAESFKAASRMMVFERRRFFRYPLMLPVELKLDGVDKEGTMTDLSEGGMAIWSLNTHAPGTALEFSFTLPFGGTIQGQGKIAWTETDGSSGVSFHLLPDHAYVHLFSWLSRRGKSLFHRPTV